MSPPARVEPMIPEPQGEPEPRGEGASAAQSEVEEGAAASSQDVGVSSGADSGGVGAPGDPASVGVQSIGNQPLASGPAFPGHQGPAGGFFFIGEWQYPRDLFEEMQMFEEAQRRSMEDRPAQSSSDSEHSEPELLHALAFNKILGCRPP